jgi:hypothetical protein
MSDEKLKKRSEMTEEERESYDKTVSEFDYVMSHLHDDDEKMKEILDTSPKKKEGLFEKLGCLGSVVFIIFVLVLLKLLFLF